ncbi:DUF1427 family protein [Streptomyces sp. G1]|uniref:DUF1427 family protein n=1 Tax=Streptomyces sp. G1 TaxID=361572 RepID=UPI00202E14DE|nr:DUF1427 family protein [Streptomyces sp. G1]MCM1965885.1 XapX domain-containing protein [Streptomyces sp. G1]
MTAARRSTASGLVGLLAGALYFLLGVPSPAPPWAALAGLLGILAGEHVTRAILTTLRRRSEQKREQPPGNLPFPARKHP